MIKTMVVALVLFLMPLALAQETPVPKASPEAASFLKVIPLYLIFTLGYSFCGFSILCADALYQSLSAICLPCILACFPFWLFSYLLINAFQRWFGICYVVVTLLLLCFPYLRNPSLIPQMLKALRMLLKA